MWPIQVATALFSTCYFMLRSTRRSSTRRPAKRGPPVDVYPSPFSVNFVSATQEDDGRVTKKRTIEKTKHDPQSLLDFMAFDIDSVLLSADAATPQTNADVPVEPKEDAASRGVSVSVFLLCHVTVGLHDTDVAL